MALRGTRETVPARKAPGPGFLLLRQDAGAAGVAASQPGLVSADTAGLESFVRAQLGDAIGDLAALSVAMECAEKAAQG